MSAPHRPRVIATLLKLVGLAPEASPVRTGPGCTCASCVQAWDRHQPAKKAPRERRRHLRPGLY